MGHQSQDTFAGLVERRSNTFPVRACVDLGYFSYRPIKSVTPVNQGKTVLKLGIFPRVPIPEWESFAIRRQEWEKPVEGCVQYKTKSLGEKL